MTRAEVAAELGISVERVRQIEEAALQKLRRSRSPETQKMKDWLTA
jgi:DNA-directed RNA polymerase sigma subunit (sigma70/sigma32)